MAEQTKKSKYNFGGHELDAKLYLQNIRDNAETFLNSKTDWTPEQKEEWKHAYTNFTNALQEDINNGGGRFSTDEFGTITDTKGEFSNTDSDNYYYNNKGQQISQEDYDALKERKQNKYQAFEANRQFASYANQIGRGLREALAAKNKTSDDTNGFDYAKNGFDAYWQKKYNPAGTANDLQPYWNKDKEGEYTNRVAETMADLDDYMSKQEMNDDVKAAYTNYRNILGQYNPSDKNFNLDTWKNNMILAASRAGISGWNNGYFNIGSQSTTPTEDKKPEAFDINNDQAVIDKYKLADQIAAHPEQREHLLDLARRQYNQESQSMTDEYNAAIKKQQEAAHNKIWEQYLLNNPYIGDVNKRVGRTGTTSFWSGAKSTKKAQDYVSQTIMSQEEQDKVHNNIGYVGKLRPEVQAALTSAHWNTDENPLLKQLNVFTTKGLNLKNLGNWYQYNWDQLMARRDTSMKGWTPVKDNKGNEVWKRNDSLRGNDGTYFYMFMGRDGKLHTYRSKPYSTLKAEAIAKGQLGMSIYTKQVAENVKKQREDKKAISNPQTPHDKKVALIKQEKIGGNPFSDRATFLRTTALATDVGALVASFSGVGAPASALIGAAATAQNQAADMAEGQGFWESLGNNALGYGMDALSVIPFVRGITGTGRIVKTASKLAPHIITAIGAISALKNKDAYLNSWHKVTSNPSQLNRQDWSNIYDSLRLIISGTTAGTQAIKGNRAMKGALSKDKVKVKTNEGYVVVDKSKLEGIKGTKGLEAQNKALQKATGNSNLRFNAARNKYRFWKTKDQAKIKEADVYDFTKPNTRMINGIEYERPYKWGELGIANRQWQSPKWMNGILDKIEVSGLKPTGRTQADIDYGNRRISQNFSVAQLRELSNKINPMVSEWKSLKTQAQSARKNAAEALGKARKATDPQIKANYENSAKSYLDYIRNKAKEYQKLKGDVKDGKITFDLGSNKQVELAWNDILKKYGVKYKQGGSIQKLASGNSINGNPYGVLQAFGTYDPSNYVSTYGGEQKGMQTDGTYGAPYISQGAGIGQGRIKTDKNYSTFTNESREKAKNIENQQLYKNYTDALIKGATDYLNTPEAERAIKWNKDNNEFLYWSEQFDNQYKEGDKGRFFSSPGVLNTSWKTTNNDSYNSPAGQQNDVITRIKAVRNDQQLARAHNDREKEGKRYFWEENGVKNWVDAANIDKLDKTKFGITLFGDSYGDDGTHWNDYKITANSQVNPAENNKDKPGFKFNNPINKQLIIDTMDQIRVNNAINANDRIAATLKQSPILYDPQEDHRYIQSDLDAEMNGQQIAAQLTRTASHPITSDGNLQSMLQLEAASKGNDAIIAGRQQSNQRSREMQEQAWQQELVNHTNRHDVAMKNRESLYNTTNYNKQIDATNINANYTVEDARAQETILPYKQDREIDRAEQKSQRDRLAMRQIDDSLRLGLGKYASSYNLSPDDVQLWEDVYVNGSKTLDDIKKNPVLTKRWNNIKYTVGQIQSDLIGDYYGAPRSKYWTIRQSTPFYEYSTKIKEAKKGAKLNLRKVREAAKGEKLAVAQLKAQTADADRFYKTTKDHIDRMYAAISRTMNYSSTKKKRKKKKNYDI